jgi:hypothetical protein
MQELPCAGDGPGRWMLLHEMLDSMDDRWTLRRIHEAAPATPQTLAGSLLASRRALVTFPGG